MLCPSCNADNPDKVRFCHQCGRSFQAADNAQTVMLDGSATGFGPPPGASQSATWVMPAASGARPVMPANLAPGTAFGSRYRIEALLGEGGMGAVYKAYDTELGRTVALKLVRPELATSPQTMQRFKQELLLASKISHKNILRIHDLGDAGGVKFITMALVEGTDLSGLIEKGGRLAFDRALKFTRPPMVSVRSWRTQQRAKSQCTCTTPPSTGAVPVTVQFLTDCHDRLRSPGSPGPRGHLQIG